MKKLLVLFAGVMLSVPMAQAKESSLYSIFEEPGKHGVLKQLAAISKGAEQNKRSQSQSRDEANSCPSTVKPGPLTQQAEVSTDVRCQFAYDLHRFVASKGRDYESVNSSSKSPSGAKKAFAYLPYLEQENFASNWWTKRSKSYRESGAQEKKQFLHRAIVDATDLYGWYGRRVYGTAAYVAWEEAAVQAVLKRQ
ncbi:MAG: hypothetical protein Q8T09_00560 [Candidatus Melainabacteria bacterium]|nr:hypothetical protein [Candidatus Melainabacteria bacterium]